MVEAAELKTEMIEYSPHTFAVVAEIVSSIQVAATTKSPWFV